MVKKCIQSGQMKGENTKLLKEKAQDKNHLVCVVMGQDCKKFIKMCLDSIKKVSRVVFCDGGSKKGFREYVSCLSKKYGFHLDWIQQEYSQTDKQMNGKQRNFYLKYLKENYPDDWCLCLDADEVVEDIDKIKEFIQIAEPKIYSPKMRHLIQDLAHEDATVQTHTVPNRLFKISLASHYPEVEHPVLQGKKNVEYGVYLGTTIWHLAYAPNLWDIKKRYDCHMSKSEMHTPEFLEEWRDSHLLGFYPKKEIDICELPEVILREFGINKEKYYFKKRNLEHKHWLDIYHWKQFFKLGDKNV